MRVRSRPAILAAALLLAACADGGPTAPRARPASVPAAIRVPDECPVGFYCPPGAEPYDVAPLLGLGAHATAPEVIDLVSATLERLRDDPRRSAAERQQARDLLAQMPDVRAKLAAPPGAHGAAATAGAAAAGVGVGGPELGTPRPAMFDEGYHFDGYSWTPYAGYTADAYSVSSGHVSTFAFGPRPGFPGYFNSGQAAVVGPGTGFAANGVDCAEPFYEWAVATGGMLAGAATASAGALVVVNMGPAATPAGWGLVRKGVGTVVVTAPAVWFKTRHLVDCLDRLERARHGQP